MYITNHFQHDQRGNVVEPASHGPFPITVYYRNGNGDLAKALPNSFEAGYKRLKHMGNRLCKI